MIRHNVHLNTTFYQRETAWKPNVKVNEEQAMLELVAGLAILALLISMCLMVEWAT